MIGRVQQVPAIGPDDSDARVLAFAAGLRRLRALRGSLDAAVRTLLVLGVPWLLGAWLLPQHLPVTALAVLAITGLVAVIAAVRAWRIADALLLRGMPGTVAPGDLTILGDELATWLEWQRHTGPVQPMATWLGREVAVRLPAIDAPALQHVGRARLGRMRYLAAAIVLLLLAWLLSFWFQPSWPGVLGGKPEAARPVVPPQVGIVPVPGAQPEAKPGSDGKPPPRNPEPRPGEPPPKGNEEQPAKPEPPAPLLNLPEQRHFVIPEHIDDGPTRRMRMHAAELAESGAANAPPPVTQGGQGEVPAPPPPTRETFEHAREVALRSRHVPAEEQPIVKRFFELLQKAAK